MAFDTQASQFYHYLVANKDEYPFASNFAKLIGFALNFPGLTAAQDQFKNKAGGNQHQQNLNSTMTHFIDFKDIVSLNMQLKSKSIIGLLFMVALLIVVFRFSKRSENFKQKLPKTLSLFWFFSTIQLYLDLNILHMESRPYAKALFLNLSPIDNQTFIYIPDILHLLLFLVSLFYFFSLLIRFNEFFGHEDVEQYVDQVQRQLAQEQRQQNNQQAQEQQQQHANENIRHDIGGLVSQSLIQVDCLTWRSSLEFYHLSVLIFILTLTFSKLVMLHQGVLFVRITSMAVSTLDNMEMFTNSPRVLALFSVSFLAYSQYVGRTQVDKQQYFFQKVVPFFIVVIHSAILLLKRKLILTYDDIFCLIIFVTSLCLYYTYESPDAQRNSRFPQPFLHNGALKNIQPYAQQAPLSEEEKIRQYYKNKNAEQIIREIEAQNQAMANRPVSQEEIMRRKAYIDEELRKRRQEQEEYLRQKKLIQEQRAQNQMISSPSEEYDETQDNEDDEDDEDNEEYEYSDNNDSGLFEYLQNEEKKLSAETGSMYGFSKSQIKQKLQEYVFQQLNQQLNEDTKKVLMNGSFGSEEQELLKKYGLLNSINQRQPNQQQQQQVTNERPQAVATQGGQGQQSNNAKQTAHKMPTKAPTGRPNMRKRR